MVVQPPRKNIHPDLIIFARLEKCVYINSAWYSSEISNFFDNLLKLQEGAPPNVNWLFHLCWVCSVCCVLWERYASIFWLHIIIFAPTKSDLIRRLGRTGEDSKFRFYTFWKCARKTRNSHYPNNLKNPQRFSFYQMHIFGTLKTDWLFEISRKPLKFFEKSKGIFWRESTLIKSKKVHSIIKFRIHSNSLVLRTQTP